MVGQFVEQSSGYVAFVPDPLPRVLDLAPDVTLLVAEATAAIGRLSGAAAALPDAPLLREPLVRLEALSSSRIEGTRTNVDGLLSAPRRDDDEAVEEVRANLAAMRRAVERLDELPISLRLLREAHAELLRAPRHRTLTPGEFRRSQNWMGPPGATLTTARFVPPPPDDMHAALHDLEHFVHDHRLPAVVAAALAHYQFEAIHPFLDGNGRIGRILAVLVLVDAGAIDGPYLHLSTHLEAHRTEYVRLLGETSRTGDLDPWLRFFVTALRDSAFATHHRMLRASAQLEWLRQLARDAALTTTGARLAVRLVVDPYVRVPDLVEELGVSTPTAQRAVDALVGAGVLEEVTGQRRNRVYVARRVVEDVYLDPSPHEGR